MVYTVTLVSFIILVGSLLAGLTYKLVRDYEVRHEYLPLVRTLGIGLVLLVQGLVIVAHHAERESKAAPAPQPCICAPVQAEAAK